MSFSVANSIEHVREVAGGFPPDDLRDPFFENRDEEEPPELDDDDYARSVWDANSGMWRDA